MRCNVKINLLKFNLSNMYFRILILENFTSGSFSTGNTAIALKNALVRNHYTLSLASAKVGIFPD